MSTGSVPSGSASMVRLIRTSDGAGTPVTGTPAVSGTAVITTAVTITAAQKAGYNRAARDATKSRTVRPQPLRLITSPLIMKKTSTPRKP